MLDMGVFGDFLDSDYYYHHYSSLLSLLDMGSPALDMGVLGDFKMLIKIMIISLVQPNPHHCHFSNTLIFIGPGRCYTKNQFIHWDVLCKHRVLIVGFIKQSILPGGEFHHEKGGCSR